MIDIGLSKMALIGAVALIVIGPEKLPRVARTVGTLLGKAQRYVADVKAEVNRSMELDELRKMKDTVETAARDAHHSFQTHASEFQKDWESGTSDAAAAATTAAWTPPPWKGHRPASSRPTSTPARTGASSAVPPRSGTRRAPACAPRPSRARRASRASGPASSSDGLLTAASARPRAGRPPPPCPKNPPSKTSWPVPSSPSSRTSWSCATASSRPSSPSASSGPCSSSTPPGRLYDLLAAPLVAHLPAGATLIATSVISPFMVPLKILLMSAFLVALPVVLYQVWAFVAPGLYSHEKKLVLPLVISSTVLFFAGVAFCYFFVFGQVFSFIQSFAPKSITAAPDIEAYLSFVLTMFLAFGLAFEVPVVVVVLARMGIVDVAKLKSFRGYFIVVAFIIAAVVTPPDVVSQLALAVPMCLLYELGIWAAQIFIRHTQAPEDAAEQREPSA